MNTVVSFFFFFFFFECFYYIYFCCVPSLVFAQHQLSSSIGSLELSGEQCPGTLTLTCDARNLETIDTINWFVGGERYFLFDANSDSTPFTGTTTRPDILNATVQLTSVTISGNQSSFINFTLSASVSNFASLQGQNISCGNLGPEGTSSSFRIREFTLINESTLFPYQGMYLKCMNVLHIDEILTPVH